MWDGGTKSNMSKRNYCGGFKSLEIQLYGLRKSLSAPFLIIEHLFFIKFLFTETQVIFCFLFWAVSIKFFYYPKTQTLPMTITSTDLGHSFNASVLRQLPHRLYLLPFVQVYFPNWGYLCLSWAVQSLASFNSMWFIRISKSPMILCEACIYHKVGSR